MWYLDIGSHTGDDFAINCDAGEPSTLLEVQGSFTTMSDIETPPQRTYACPSCKASLNFDPTLSALCCPYCGRKEEIPHTPEAVKENSFEAYLCNAQPEMLTLAEGALEVSCKGCGATVTFRPPEVAARCAFCGMAVVQQPSTADPVLAPQGVLPFKLAAAAASSSIREWIRSRWFAPNALKLLALQSAVQGVYLPFWTYDTFTTTPYRGSRGEHYYEQESYSTTDAQGRQVRQTRQVRKTRWYPASGTVQHFFDDVLCPAITSLSSEHLYALEPWDLASVSKFDPRYLAGFKAQRYQVDLVKGFSWAKTRMEPEIDALIRRDIGGDEQRIDARSTHYSAITFKHLLLPVYVGSYRFRDKVYQVVVNARTGEVQGARPYSPWKIAAFVTVLAVLAVLLLRYAQG